MSRPFRRRLNTRRRRRECSVQWTCLPRAPRLAASFLLVTKGNKSFRAPFLSQFPLPTVPTAGAAPAPQPRGDGFCGPGRGPVPLRTLGLRWRQRGCLWKFIDLKYEYAVARPISVKSKFLLPERRIEVHGSFVRPSTKFGFQIADRQDRYRIRHRGRLISSRGFRRWRGLTLLHGRAPRLSGEQGRPRSAVARPVRLDRPFRKYAV